VALAVFKTAVLPNGGGWFDSHSPPPFFSPWHRAMGLTKG